MSSEHYEGIGIGALLVSFLSFPFADWHVQAIALLIIIAAPLVAALRAPDDTREDSGSAS